MTSSFFPHGGNTSPPAGDQVANDGWFPDLSLSELRAKTGLGSTFSADRLRFVLQVAIIDVNQTLADWRASLDPVASLADMPCIRLGDQPQTVLLYRWAVYYRARARLLETTRDYDSTKSGHDRADALENTADHWLEQSSGAIARLTGRNAITVDMI